MTRILIEYGQHINALLAVIFVGCHSLISRKRLRQIVLTVVGAMILLALWIQLTHN